MTNNRTLKWTALSAGLMVASSMLAQTARVQVIHNSADAAAAVVDIYINGGDEPAINDFAFRTATEFLNLPAGVDLTIGIAPGNSTGPQDIITALNTTVNLVDGETYVVVANGIVSPTGYNPAPAFNLDIFAPGREAASASGNTDILVLHGSTDAPTVQVAETAVLGGAVVVQPFSFGEFTPDYLEVPAVDLTLEIQLPDGTPVVAYDAPLATLGLENVALVAVASGFLNPAANSDGPAFGVWVALPSGGELVELPLATDPSARVQIIHNSADAAAAVVDIYINGGDEPAINDLAFRTATEFLDLPAGVDLTIGIAPGNSTGPQDIITALNTTVNLVDGETYVVVANGIVSPTGYNPAPAFALNVFASGREAASVSGNTDILVLHGSTDAPTVQVAETAVLGGAVVVQPFSFGEFTPDYLEVPAVDLTLEIQLPDGTPVVAYDAPLATLGLENVALVAVASGFLNPAVNSDGPAFGIWVALPSGGALVELPLATDPSARVQIIHNSADAAAAVVDIYINGGDEPAINDLAFRTATEFLDLPAGVDLTIGIAPGSSTGPQDIITALNTTVNLADGETYVVVANGIVSPTGYNPAIPFQLYVQSGAREAATSGAGNTDILVFHGCTDAPVVDVAEIAVLGGATIVNDLGYGEFDGYLEVPTLDFTLQVQTADGTPLLNYLAPLETLELEGVALTVVASGFLNTGSNSNGPGFGLWVALPSGGDLVELPITTSIADNSVISSVSAWPNPASDLLTVDVETSEMLQAEVRLTDMTGRVVRSLAGSSLANGANRLVLDVTGLATGSYTLSVVGDRALRTLPVQVIR
ncbi:MAG: DUF4397 domain-containing protein [Flavobacteriales bacterium]|nr:DUF4397 domain-containing protein [Flavobacteriales bacterium]